MPIALSLVLHPSKKLQILALLFSVILLLVGIATGYASSFSSSLRIVVAALLVVSALVICWHVKTELQKHWAISITEHGEFHCHLLSAHTEAFAQDGSEIRQLADGTVLWPKILFLRLQRLKDDNMINLVVLSDALSEDEFRRLSIACRWIVAHAKQK